MSRDRSGLLIIRVWVEQGSSEPLRAQLRSTTDVAAGFDQDVTFVSRHAVVRAVDEWLRRLPWEEGEGASPPT